MYCYFYLCPQRLLHKRDRLCLKCRFFNVNLQDPVKPTREQLKVIALQTPLHISGAHSDNLYLRLQSKFPNADVHANPAHRLRYEYYLRVCGSYYADKMYDRMEAKAATNAAAMQWSIDQTWRSFRVTQLSLDGRGRTASDDDSDTDSDAAGPVAAATDTLTHTSDLLDMPNSMELDHLPNTEQIDALLDTQLPGADDGDVSDSYAGDDDDDIEDELAYDGESIVQLAENLEDPMVVDPVEVRETPPDTESQSQRESQMDTLEQWKSGTNATSTQTQQ